MTTPAEERCTECGFPASDLLHAEDCGSEQECALEHPDEPHGYHAFAVEPLTDLLAEARGGVCGVPQFVSKWVGGSNGEGERAAMVKLQREHSWMRRGIGATPSLSAVDRRRARRVTKGTQAERPNGPPLLPPSHLPQVNAQLPNQSNALPQFAGTGVGR